MEGLLEKREEYGDRVSFKGLGVVLIDLFRETSSC